MKISEAIEILNQTLIEDGDVDLVTLVELDGYFAINSYITLDSISLPNDPDAEPGSLKDDDYTTVAAIFPVNELDDNPEPFLKVIK